MKTMILTPQKMNTPVHPVFLNLPIIPIQLLLNYFLLFIILIGDIRSQSIARLTNVGSNNLNFHNSISDDQDNIYYATRDNQNSNSITVTKLSKELVLLWSYNYNVSNVEPITGLNYKDGKIYLTTSGNNNVIFLILDLAGNILFSKRIVSDNPTFASTIMHNNDLIITTSYNVLMGSIEITRLTPNFVTVFNKRIQMLNRDLIYVADVKQFGNKIYFGGSARFTSNLGFSWFFGALELNGNLAFLHEYKVSNSDQYPNNHFVSMDSVAPDLIISAGYTNDLDANSNVNTYLNGLLVKMNPLNGLVLDHLILDPQNSQDFMFLFGIKYHPNKKIRICGGSGIGASLFNRNLVFGEVDLDFKNHDVKFSNFAGSNTGLTQFIDYDHVSGRMTGEPILVTAQGEGVCKSNNECFRIVNFIQVNNSFIRIQNSYTLIDISYPITDLPIQRKPIQSNLSANCGISICETSHTITICKQQYIYNYGGIQQNPKRITNLTPNIAGMTHDPIDKEIILDPLQSGIAVILMETQVNLFLTQLDTFKFAISNDSLPVLDLGGDKVLCNGDSTVLTTGFDSTRWFDGSIRRTITVKVAGIYYASYTNNCGTASDTIIITTDQTPKINIGNDVLLCGNQTTTLISNYDNTIWNNGSRGKQITVSTPGRVIAFVSTACGTSFDTVDVFKFDKTQLSAGKDLEICDPVTNLTGSFVNPNPNLFSTDIEWKQIDQLPTVTFDNTNIINPIVSNLTKDQKHVFELNIRIGNNCIIKDTVNVLSKTCFIDSCAFIIEKNCLTNGMVELRAIDANGQIINPKTRIQEFFWDIKDGPAGRGYSVTNKNPIIVSNHTRYCLTSKIYTWKAGRPHTVEYADICEIKSCDSLSLNCSGPCSDFSFILSSCLDDYDEEYNLNFLPQFCRSVCVNSCDYIVGIFDLNGNIIDPNFYSVKWSTGETGATTMQKGCINYNITVEVRRGDCVWYGRYRPSCNKYNGILGDVENHNQFTAGNDYQILIRESDLNTKRPYTIFNITGQYMGNNEYALRNLQAGVYYIVLDGEPKKQVKKIVVSGDNFGKQ